MDRGRPYARIRFSKHGLLAYVGHLDLARTFDRAVRRSGLPVAYSEGFNPRAKIAFASPLPVGVESEAELCVVDLVAPVDLRELHRRLSAQLPPSLEIVELSGGYRGRRSPLADVAYAEYLAELRVPCSAAELEAAVSAVLAAESVRAWRRTKSGEGQQEIRPGIVELEVVDVEARRLRMRLQIAGENVAKPAEVVEAIRERLGGGSCEVGRLTRTALF